jgi:hypothetical protein
MSRVLPMIHWEVHVLQSGLDRYATAHPWFGLPLVALLLALIWTLYWILLLPVLALCLFSRALHAVQMWWRTKS